MALQIFRIIFAAQTSEILHSAQFTVGDEGVIADLRYMSIFSAFFGLPAPVLLPSTYCTDQIWICG